MYEIKYQITLCLRWGHRPACRICRKSTNHWTCGKYRKMSYLV